MGLAYAVVISEKGGAERREEYQQSELTIGRVQGNDLMLPKGNVSKRHAQLVFREGRFIVRDLNSTNGTYVNRRRISQATIVRQGDRIYIGDFVLRVEVDSEESSGPLIADRGSLSPLPVREPLGTSPELNRVSQEPGPVTGPHRYPPVPPAPKVPSGAHVDRGSQLPGTLGAVDRAPSTREESVDQERAAYRAALRALVENVNERVESRLLERELSEAAMARIERNIAEAAESLRSDGTIPAQIAQERLLADAKAEICELGALGPLLSDESVNEIFVTGLHSVTVVRAGTRGLAEPPFSTEATLSRAIARLCRQSGAPLGNDEFMVRRQLPNGFALTALTGSAIGGRGLLRLDRPQRVDVTIEDLVRAGTISRAMATFFKHVVGVRANILVVGSRASRPSNVICALAAAATDGHVVALQAKDLIVSSGASMSHVDLGALDVSAERLVEFAASMPHARLAIDNLGGGTAMGALEAIGSGADGVIAGLRAHSLRRGLARLPAEIAASRPGLTPAAAREWVAASFDLMIEVASLRDGRQRVLRVAEPRGVADGEIVLHDIFGFSIERMASGGAVEGTFQATGIIPRVMEELTARGIVVDSSLFTRPPSR